VSVDIAGEEPQGGLPEEDMLRRVAGSGAWTVVGYVASAGSAFGISVLLARAFGPSAWGRYSYYLWILSVLPSVLALGVPNALAKTLAELLGRGEDDQARGLFRLAAWFHVLMLPIPMAVGLFLILAHRRGAWFTLVLIVGVSVGLLILDGEAVMTGLRRFKALGMFSVVLSSAELAAAGVAYAVGLTWQRFVVIMVALITVGLSALVALCWRSIRRMRPPRIARSEAAGFARFAGLCAFTLLLDNLLWGRPELLFLDRYRTSADIGLYSSALRLASVAAVLPFVACKPLLPEFSRLRGEQDAGRLAGLYPRACRLLVLMAAPLACIGAALSPRAMEVVYGRAYRPASGAMVILMGSSLIYALTGPIVAAIMTGPRPRFIAEVGAVSVVANLLLDLALIPPLGIEGAALSNVAVQLCWVILTIGYVSRRLGFVYPAAALVRALGLAALAALVAGAVSRPVPGIVGLVLGGVAGVVVYAGLALVTGTVSADDLSALRTKR
jgi:O-antigen/teichoic acid export membrane protein